MTASLATVALPDPQIDDAFRSARHTLRNLILLITEQCNLRCDYCYIRKVPRAMSRETAQQSVDFLFAAAKASRDPLSITFFGGEPLLKPALIEFIHDAATRRARQDDREISFSMTTNATLVTERNAEMIARLRIGLRVSLDGIGDVQDRHRRTVDGKGSFSLIARNLDRIARLDAVSVRLTVTPDTAAQLPDSVRWLVDRGFKSISISPVTEAQWTTDSLGALLQAQRELHALQPAAPVHISSVAKTSRALGAAGPRWGCGAARGMAAVDAEGYLYPCHRFVGYFRNGVAQRIGHVATGFDTARREYYIAANHSSSRPGCGHGLFTPQVAREERACGNCSLLSVCGSNCMAVNEHMTGDPARPHPINRVLAQIDAAASLHQAHSGHPAFPDPCGERT